MIRRILGQALKWACTALLVLAILFLIAGLRMGERPGPLLFFVGVLAAPFVIRLLVIRKHRTAPQLPEVREAEKEDVYIDTGSVIYKADGSPIRDDEIPYLVQIGYEKAVAEDKARAERLGRTPRDEELSDRFFSRYLEEIKGYEDRIYETAQLIGPAGKKWMKTATPEEIAEKIRLCQSAIDAFEDFRAFCGKHGKGGRIYFEDMWEHCHNSANPDFSYIDDIVSLQNELKNK